jgi:hypothetical protein
MTAIKSLSTKAVATPAIISNGYLGGALQRRVLGCLTGSLWQSCTSPESLRRQLRTQHGPDQLKRPLLEVCFWPSITACRRTLAYSYRGEIVDLLSSQSRTTSKIIATEPNSVYSKQCKSLRVTTLPSAFVWGCTKFRRCDRTCK